MWLPLPVPVPVPVPVRIIRDVLGLMQAASDKDTRGDLALSDDELRGNLILMFIAGHETTTVEIRENAAMNKFFGVVVPFLNLVGVKSESWGQGESRVALSSRPDITNHFGSVHGGAVATLLDVAMASAARSLHPETGVVTVSMTLNYLQAATGELVAAGRVRRGGRSMVFCEGEITNSNGEVVATAMGTFKVARVVADA